MATIQWLKCVCLGVFMSYGTWVQGAITVVDDVGRAVELPHPAKRIISLSPHTTELLFAAGAGKAVVGVVSYSDYPPQAAQLPIVGDAHSFDLESIVTMRPDLVVAWKSGNPAHQLERIRSQGITVYYSEPKKLSDIPDSLLRLGTLAGTQQVAKQAGTQFLKNYKALQQDYSDKKKVKVFYQLWDEPLMTVNGTHFISDVITLCGGINVFAELETLVPRLDKEAVIAARPQVIVASGDSKAKQLLKQGWQQWQMLPAVKYKNLFIVEANLISRPTPRLLQGARRMCELLEQARQNLRD